MVNVPVKTELADEGSGNGEITRSAGLGRGDSLIAPNESMLRLYARPSETHAKRWLH